MAKNNKKPFEENKRLDKENKESLQRLLLEAKKSIDSITAENIDALVFSDQNALKIFTEKSADKTYRVLIEKMNEGAVTLTKD